MNATMRTSTARTLRPASRPAPSVWPARAPGRPARLASRSTAPEQASAVVSTAEDPVIVVQFCQEGGATAAVDVASGDQLRAAMLDAKVDLYTTWGKIWSCGGAGQCGTCIVQVEEGAELLSERTATEQKKLKNKPESWRLACQTIVGDGSNSGSVVIRTKPQSK